MLLLGHIIDDRSTHILLGLLLIVSGNVLGIDVDWHHSRRHAVAESYVTMVHNDFEGVVAFHELSAQ